MSARPLGGIKPWPRVRKDIIRHLNDRGCASTLMVDFYGMPYRDGRAWPGRYLARTLPHHKKAPEVEQALVRNLCDEMGPDFNASRFIPYVAMYEFEALLFSDCDALGYAVGQEKIIPTLHNIRNSFTSPEEINDSPQTAPSKRLEALFAYEKPLHAGLAVMNIGLSKMRLQCPHFNSWLTKLEMLHLNQSI